MGHLKRNILVDYKKSFVTQNGLYDKQDNLVLLIRPGPTDKPGDSAVDASKNSHTVTYDRWNTDHLPVQNDIDTPFSLRPVSFNPDSFNCHSTADLSFIKTADSDDLSFDDNTGPSPFSISMWVKGNPNATTWAWIMGKQNEYAIRETSKGGVLRVSFHTDSNNYSYLHTATAGLLGSNEWHHLVVTYNGIYDDREISIYVDGVLDSSGEGSVQGTYSGMTAGSNDLYWGTLYRGAGNKLSGKVSEMGIWNAVLSVTDVKALYEVTQGVYKSGVISNPPRVMLHDQDVRTGSYPTIMRTGDPDFSGKFASTFDDTSTIIFDTGEKLYPTNLFARHKFVSGGVATPNKLGGITAQGNSTAGVADAHVVFTPGENISPFNESRLYIDNDSQFYATGTTSGVLPGFSQRLGSKTSFTIDINPRIPTNVAFSTGTLPNAEGYSEGVNSGIAYYNFADEKWEVLGDLSTGSNVDILNFDQSIRSRGLVAFAPSGMINNYNGDDQMCSYVGLPVSSYGFPFSEKYDATGSQTYCMSSSISHPFLVEKIVIDFSASFGPENISGDLLRGPCVKQFFLLNQFDNTDNSTTIKTFSPLFGGTQPTLPAADSSPVTQSLGKTKDLIGVGEIAHLAEVGTTPLTGSWRRDLNIIRPVVQTQPASNVRATPITGSYRLEFAPRTYPLSPALGPLPLAKSASRGIFYQTNTSACWSAYMELLGSYYGGRQLTGASSGHSFIRGTPGVRINGTFHNAGLVGPGAVPAGGGTRVNPMRVVEEDLRRESPYILDPSSKIVIGYSNTPNFISNGKESLTSNPGKLTEGYVAESITTLSPGAGKITFYGSLIRDNLPVEMEAGQPLTSDAIHEALHFDNPVYDQWDVGPRSALSGSYVDLVITGSMLALDSLNNLVPEAPDVRQVEYSVAAGQAGPSGSIQRFVRLTDQRGTLYDSYPPDVLATLDILGYGAGSISDVGSATIMPGVPGMGFSSRGVIPFWWFIPAYEKNEKRFFAAGFGNPPIQTYNASDTDLGSAQYVIDDVYLLSDTDLVPASGYVSNDRGDVVKGRKALRNQKKALWGFGDSVNRAPIFERTHVSPKRWRPVIRGYKYGLAGIFGSSVDARFRRDKYGQFRDMLEQRKFPATIEGGSVQYPVSINFVPQDTTTGGQSSPEKTHSQNLSRFATSSLPYYDGQTKERADNPDIVLAPVSVP